MPVPTQDEIGQRIKKILAEDFKVDPARVTPDATFRGDMAMDSLDVVDLVFFVQKEFQIKAKVEEYQDIKTFKRLVEHLHNKLQNPAPPPG
ncbi:MAG: acyl carrier protein [Deltaproteobacteria bacterium]|nr:acyl carrier protein [Deltaproteobacteria bacterium]